VGPVELEVPRDRARNFSPQIVPKRHRSQGNSDTSTPPPTRMPPRAGSRSSRQRGGRSTRRWSGHQGLYKESDTPDLERVPTNFERPTYRTGTAVAASLAAPYPSKASALAAGALPSGTTRC
jgi:hypothetical protein